MDGVDVMFEACVVVDVFPPGICLGPQELKCYNINHQEPTSEARIDERASLVVSFVVPQAAPIPLRGLVDTGSGVSILTFSAFNRVAARTGTVLKHTRLTCMLPRAKPSKLSVWPSRSAFSWEVTSLRPTSSWWMMPWAWKTSYWAVNCSGPSSARGSNLHEDSGPRTRETCLASCTYTGR